jgi:transposase
MSVIIGIDPHKAVHAACVIDGNEVQLAELTVRSGPRQVGQLLEWATPFEARTWAIESAGGLGYLLAQQLLARGERVLDVPSTLAARVRLLGSGKSSKNDANDARAVAIAALRAPSLPTVRSEDHVTVLRLLAKAHLDAGRARSRACSRLHALVNELVPGGISKELVVNQARSTLSGIEAGSVVQRQRLQLAVELLDEIADLDNKLRRSKARVTAAVAASGTTLTNMFGVGPIIAAILVGYTGDPARFPTAGHFAAYNGTAPVEFSSSGRTVHRLSRRGNRTLNHAIHLVAVTQIRHSHSEGRAYYDAKLAAGSQPRIAMRALKRHISNRVFRHLRGELAR